MPVQLGKFRYIGQAGGWYTSQLLFSSNATSGRMSVHMNHRIAALLMALGLLSAGIGLGAEFQAGAASADVTPPTGLPMWGYGARRDKPNQGVMDPLQANALVLAVGAQRLALVGLDMGRAPPRESFGRIRQRVLREAGVQHVLIVASHTHHGPVLEVAHLPDPKHSYLQTLETKLADVIIAAAKKLQPARIGAAHRMLTLNRNRHSKMAERPVDAELIVVRVDDAAGKPIAIAVNFAAHPTIIPASVMLYSADYPGHMRRLVERELGGVCLFLQGAAGDLSPNIDNRRGPQAFGEALGREVVAAAKITTAAPAKPSIQVREEELRFPNLRMNPSNPLIRKLMDGAFFPALVDFYVKEYADGLRPRLTVALVNNEIGLVGASGEFFCSHSMNLKRRARLPHTLFLGYCNDYHQYFPTIEAAAEGGYGADPAVSPAEIGAGEQIINRALFHLYDLQGKFKRLPF